MMPIVWILIAITFGVAIFIVALFRISAIGIRLRYKDSAHIIPDLPYVSGSLNPKQRLDVYVPKHPSAPFPMVVFVHGGFWIKGDKNYHQWLLGVYANIGLVFAHFGIGTAVISYRLGPEVGIADQLSDVSAAKHYVREHAHDWGANNRLFMMGHSAGAHIVTLLFLRDPLGVDGCIALSPVLDIATMAEGKGARFNEYITYPVFGREPAAWADYSPYGELYRSKAPLDPLHIFVAEHDLSYIKQPALSLHHLHVQSVPRINHTLMVTAFGKPSNRIAQDVVAIIQSKNMV